MTSVKDKTTGAPDASEATTPGLGAVEEQATSFRHVREARRTELVEDYVELIADLIDDAGEARPVDIAARLGVTKPTVNKMLKRLQQEELVTQRPYRAVFLTDAGREPCLRALGISPGTARNDAEGIEHYVSDETLEAFQRLVDERAKD